MTKREPHPLEGTLERSRVALDEGALVHNAIYVIRHAWGRIGLARREAEALVAAYFKAKTALYSAQVEAQRAADDAAAQRALVELLTNELDKRQQGDG